MRNECKGQVCTCALLKDPAHHHSSKELHSSKMAGTEQQLAPICPALRTLCKAPADPREITWHLNLLNRGQSHLVQVQLLGLGEFLCYCYLLDWSLGGQLGVRGERTINLVSHMFLKFSCEEKDLANWTDVVMIISELCIFLPDSSNPDIGCSI